MYESFGFSESHKPLEMSNFKMYADLMGMNWYPVI